MADDLDTEIVRQDILFEQGYLPRCGEYVGDPFPGVDDNRQYCSRWENHEAYGLDHCSINGTTW